MQRAQASGCNLLQTCVYTVALEGGYRGFSATLDLHRIAVFHAIEKECEISSF